MCMIFIIVFIFTTVVIVVWINYFLIVYFLLLSIKLDILLVMFLSHIFNVVFI